MFVCYLLFYLISLVLRGDTPVWFAIARANKRFTKMFLENRDIGPISNTYGPYQWTLLMRALNELDEDAEEVIKMLAEKMIEKGVGLNQKNIEGKNAAFMAAYKGNDKLLAFLASKGLNLLAHDDNGNTALHYATTIAVAETLLRGGVPCNKANHQGNTPLHSAYAFHPEITDFLISNGGNVTVKNNHGMKPSECSSCQRKIIALPYLITDLQHRGTSGLYIPKN